VGALYVSESKKNAKIDGAVIVFEDEASFQQTPTLRATWARRGCQPQIPTRGERNTQKIFGAVSLNNAHFTYLHQQDYFQWETYLAFVDQVLVPTFYRRNHRVVSDSGQRLLPQEAGELRLVCQTPALRPGVPITALLAGTQRGGAHLEIHPAACHPQPLLRHTRTSVRGVVPNL
jgi:hypothetical protein